MGLLDNKVALITGAGRGIGKAIALRFAQEGCNIAFTDIALNDVVMETEKELQALGIKAKAYASNAANFEETHQVVDEIVKDFGRIDILVNNAGITKRHQREPQVGVQLHQGCAARHVEAGWWQCHQHELRGGCLGQCQPMQLQRLEGRYHWLHQECGQGDGCAQHSSQRHCSWFHHHGHDQRLA
ncbi:MAG: 3-oxoacyl-[acyl-carrier-protein] reductase [bacterium F082]|nr:MAG: 3-oxoacyl-[acyl-carrier-protein] reductase [bacterium F082]